MHLTTLTFPQIKLRQRDGHKLRGYFAQQFGQDSDLWHNHTESSKAIYRYPRIQYKVLKGSPTMVGINEGATLLIQRFLEIKEIEIDGMWFPLDQKNMQSQECLIGVRGVLESYEFLNPWLPLNQERYREYVQEKEAGKVAKLESILIRNMQALMSAVGYFEEKDMMVKLNVKPITVQFKNQPMLGFKGSFVSNVRLPDFVGLGKSVARGYGAILRKKVGAF